MNIQMLRDLRYSLHAVPCLAGNEGRTAQVVYGFLKEHTDLELHLEGNRLWAVHREEGAMETVAFRAELDAIKAPDGGAYHGCGHDGHSTAVAGLALELENKKTGKNIVFLFQNSEETGAGALPFRDYLLEQQKIDRIYGLHNIPGEPEGMIVVRRGTFACASRGIVILVHGKQTHAAYPEQGKSPVPVLSRTALELQEIREKVLSEGKGKIVMATVVGLHAGDDNFGIAAGEGRLCFTLRSDDLDALDSFEKLICGYAGEICSGEGMTMEIETCDAFPDTVNDDALLLRAEECWNKKGFPIKHLLEPMRWSEDFGWYGKKIPALYFGVGAGNNWPGLHTGNYCFNDNILPRCIEALMALI